MISDILLLVVPEKDKSLRFWIGFRPAIVTQKYLFRVNLNPLSKQITAQAEIIEISGDIEKNQDYNCDLGSSPTSQDMPARPMVDCLR